MCNPAQPVSGWLRRLTSIREHVATTWRHARLRQLTIGVSAALIAERGFTVALAIVAHDRGGAGLVAVAGMLQMGAAAVAAPVLGHLAAGRSWRVVFAVASAAEAVAMGACAAAVVAGAPDAVVLGTAAVASAAFGACRPARLALMRWLASTTSALASANVVMAASEAFSYFAGPLVAAVAVAAAGHGVALAAPAAFVVAAAVTAHRLPAVEPAGERLSPRLTVGFVSLVRDAPAPAALFVIQTFVRGLLNVLLVVVALEVLDGRESDVGLFHAVLGVGGLVGVVVAGGAAAPRGLLRRMAVALVFWGAPLAVIGLVPNTGIVVLGLLVVGIANVAADVNGFTALQRAVPGVRAPQAFAALEALLLTGIGIGSLAAAALDAAVGVRAALIVAGMVLPAAVVLALPALLRLGRRLDLAEGRLEAMRRVPSLAAMSVAALDVIARYAEEARFAPGDLLVGAGAADAEVFVLLDGQVRVERANTAVATVGPGEIVGEVAALYGVARTASVVAVSDVVALRLSGSDFATAMDYSEDAHALAHEVVGTYGGHVAAAIAGRRPS